MIRVVDADASRCGGIAGNFAAGVSRTVVGDGVVVEDQNRMRQVERLFPRYARTKPIAPDGNAR